MPSAVISTIIPRPALNRPYLLRFIAQDGTRTQVAFADRAERDERGAQLLTLGCAFVSAFVRGAA